MSYVAPVMAVFVMRCTARAAMSAGRRHACFATIAALGIRGISMHPEVLKALSPSYAFDFLFHSGWSGFFSLASVVLAITGVEALYADMARLRDGGDRHDRDHDDPVLRHRLPLLAAAALGSFGANLTKLLHGACVDHLHTLPEHAIVLSLENLPTPRVAAGDRFEIDDLRSEDEGISFVRAKHGYAEHYDLATSVIAADPVDSLRLPRTRTITIGEEMEF
jgi:K+ transporter